VLRAVLLDTCAAISLMNHRPMLEAGKAAIRDASEVDGVFVSPVTAWEIGLLARSGRRRSVAFLPDPAQWMARLLAGPSIRQAPLTFEIALASSSLPEPFHDDPADRLLVATARDLGMPIVTSDRRILAYGSAGYVCVVAR
jgi:PIN domain nuclease of toxin-antitoxin system